MDEWNCLHFVLTLVCVIVDLLLRPCICHHLDKYIPFWCSMVCANTVIVDISVIWFPNEWNCVHVVCTIRCCDDATVIAVVYIFHFCCSCVRFFIIYWQCWLEMMALDFCLVVFDGIVVIAPLYWGVNDVL